MRASPPAPRAPAEQDAQAPPHPGPPARHRRAARARALHARAAPARRRAPRRSRDHRARARERRADRTRRTSSGAPRCCCRARDAGSLELVKLLARAAARRSTSRTGRARAALSWAADDGRVDLVRWLASQGAAIDRPDIDSSGRRSSTRPPATTPTSSRSCSTTARRERGGPLRRHVADASRAPRANDAMARAAPRARRRSRDPQPGGPDRGATAPAAGACLRPARVTCAVQPPRLAPPARRRALLPRLRRLRRLAARARRVGRALEALERRASARRPACLLPGFVFGWVAYAGGYLWLWRLVDVFLDGDRVLGAALWLAYSLWFARALRRLRRALRAAPRARLAGRGRRASRRSSWSSGSSRSSSRVHLGDGLRRPHALRADRRSRRTAAADRARRARERCGVRDGALARGAAPPAARRLAARRRGASPPPLALRRACVWPRSTTRDRRARRRSRSASCRRTSTCSRSAATRAPYAPPPPRADARAARGRRRSTSSSGPRPSTSRGIRRPAAGLGRPDRAASIRVPLLFGAASVRGDGGVRRGLQLGAPDRRRRHDPRGVRQEPADPVRGAACRSRSALAARSSRTAQRLRRADRDAGAHARRAGASRRRSATRPRCPTSCGAWRAAHGRISS